MSMLLMVKAFHLKLKSPIRKLVLLKLADNADDKGVCFPSHGNIAKLCECSEKTVRRHIQALEELGLVSVENRYQNNQQRSNIYYLHLDTVTERAGTERPTGGDTVTDRGGHSDRPGGDTVTDRTSHYNQSKNQPSTDEEAAAERMNYKGYGRAFNEAVNDSNVNMPILATPDKLSDDRKGKLKAFIVEYNERFKDTSGKMTPEKFKAYVLDFINQAKQDPRGFYFGNNKTNFRANFEYLLRVTTFDKVIEETL